MKKILSILLAAIMVFTLGVVAFAEGEEDTGILLPEFPTQTEGAIYFATENTYVAGDSTYEIPVYMLSNYTASTEGDVIVGLTLSLAGEAYDYGYMTVTGLSIPAEIQAMAGYELIGCDVDLAGEVNLNTVAFKVSDMSILQQEKLQVATVTVSVSPEYTGYNEDGSEMDCMLDIQAAQYFWYMENVYGMYGAYAPVEIWSPAVEFDGIPYAEQLEAIDFGAADVISGVYTVAGHLIVEPPVPTWQERLKAWAIEQAVKIITFFQGINEVLLGLLPTL
ncbi:MAG: hypothetical protein IJ447_09180 [Clostridia bacterium]|nr:hypothetical protein [Clostridia bacterium]